MMYPYPMAIPQNFMTSSGLNAKTGEGADKGGGGGGGGEGANGSNGSNAPPLGAAAMMYPMPMGVIGPGNVCATETRNTKP